MGVVLIYWLHIKSTWFVTCQSKEDQGGKALLSKSIYTKMIPIRKNLKEVKFALCLNNEGYPASLEVGKLYPVTPDEEATIHGYIRVTDESGEDYAYSAERFHVVQLPGDITETLLSITRR